MVTVPHANAFVRQLYDDGVIRTPDAKLTPLTGGVSSEIYRVDDGIRQFVVKRALAKLKVAADWYADTSRNAMEQAYIQYVGSILPEAVPQVIHADPQAGYFAMELLDGYANWKEELLDGRFSELVAKAAASALGKIHAASWADPSIAAKFDAIENFDQLRIDPYLRATAAKHPEVSEQLLAEAQRLRESRQCLMHGDYSPKNMLHRPGRFVILDCEVACHGDAAFDLAFLLNHLMLKGIFHAPAQTPLQGLFDCTVQAYDQQLEGRSPEILSATARLLPMLLLARVDGKSPVEYLSTQKQEKVRSFAITHILNPDHDLKSLSSNWYSHL